MNRRDGIYLVESRIGMVVRKEVDTAAKEEEVTEDTKALLVNTLTIFYNTQFSASTNP